MEDRHSEEVSEQFLTPKRPSKKAKTSEVIGENENENRNKIRTPSGQVLNTSVKDIRNFFLKDKGDKGANSLNNFTFGTQSTMKQLHSGNSQELSGSQSSVQSEGKGWSYVAGKKPRSGKSPISEAETNKYKCETYHDYMKGNKFAQLFTEDEKDDTEQGDNYMSEDDESGTPGCEVENPHRSKDKENTSDNDKTEAAKQTAKQADLERDKMLEELEMLRVTSKNALDTTTESENRSTNVMDVQLVVKMFHDLSTKMTDLQTSNATKEQALKKVETRQDRDARTIRELRKEVTQYKKKTEVLTSVVESLGNNQTEITNRLDMMELRGMKNSIVINGLRTDNKTLKCVEQVRQFISQELEEEVTITDCFKLGMGERKPVVIAVQSFMQKTMLYQAMDKYRKYCEEAEVDQEVYMSDYLPAEMKERRRREREIFRANENNTSTKIDMEITRRKLVIQKEDYVKKVTPPSATDILNYTEEEIDQVCKMEVKGGDKFTDQGSEFFSFILPTNNFDAIKKAYMKLRLMFPQGKHIMCAYNIPGMPRCYHEDYCEDKEIGSGRFLLNLIKRNNLTQIAIFVIRIQNGPKIGAMRFKLIEKAVQSAVNKNSFNKFMNANMTIETEQQNQVKVGTGETTTFSRGTRGATYSRRYRGSTRKSRGGRQHRGGLGLRPKSNEYDTNKRRRQDSPEQNSWLNNTKADWRPNEMVGRAELGESWPTLRQAEQNRHAQI